MEIHRIRVIEPRYVVIVQEHGHVGDLEDTAIPLYLEAIAYQPNPASIPYRALVLDIEDAFVFRERAAAELAAVWVGGTVKRVRSR